MLGEKSDALTPTLAVMLQPDLVQRFLPLPIFHDRAEALERSWEFWWRQSLGNNRFGTGFTALSNQYGMQSPMLLINGRHVPVSAVPYDVLKKIVQYQEKMDGIAQ